MKSPTDCQQHCLNKEVQVWCFAGIKTIWQNHRSKSVVAKKTPHRNEIWICLCFYSLLCAAQQAQLISWWQAHPSRIPSPMFASHSDHLRKNSMALPGCTGLWIIRGCFATLHRNSGSFGFQP